MLELVYILTKPLGRLNLILFVTSSICRMYMLQLQVKCYPKSLCNRIHITRLNKYGGNILMRLIERSISHHKQKGGLSNVMQEMKIQYHKQTRLGFYWKPKMGKSRERRNSLFSVCYSGGLQYSFLFLLFSGLAPPLSSSFVYK